MLDVGCGTGQVTRIMLNNGCRAVGIDPSGDMLGLAKKRLAKQIKKGDARLIKTTVEEMKGKKRFGMAIATYAVVAHFKDRAALTRCFRAIRRRLEPGGLFVTSFFTLKSFDEVWDAPQVDIGEYDGVFFLKRTIGDRDTRTAYVSVTAFIRNSRNLYQKSHTTLKMRIHSLEDITTALKDAGFKDVVYFKRSRLVEPDGKVSAFSRAPSAVAHRTYLTVAASTAKFPPKKPRA